MNKLVEIALKKPYTFVVMAIFIVVYGISSILKTPTDVFPNIKIPVVAIVWEYAGLLPDDVSGRITYVYERLLTTTVEGIAKLESNSYFGSSIIKVYLQPDTDLAAAETEITAISQAVIKALPPDISAPKIMRLEASSVPVATLQVTSESLPPSQVYNIAVAGIRPQLVTIPGAIVPHPYGGKPKQLLVSLDKQKLLARQMTAMDVHEALNKQNIVLPAGDQKINTTDWLVKTNASPIKLEEFQNMPIKRVGNAVVYLKDVADIDLAGPPQTNAVLVDGKQAVSLVVMKSGESSTLEVVQGIKDAIPQIKKSLPKGMDVKLINDASVFVKESISDVSREMMTAGMLAGLVVLLFLGSWRATVIIVTAIPLSILSSIIALRWAGQSINIMTLGGLALAVGVIVDNATVMIENIDTHLEMRKPLFNAITDAAIQIIAPTFVATMCMVVVWLPLFSLSGVSGWLFMPMAQAIMFAMAASFVLSYTLVPTMANYILSSHNHAEKHNPHKNSESHVSQNVFIRFQKGFEHYFNAFRNEYRSLLTKIIENRNTFSTIFLFITILSTGLFFLSGREFFPEVKSNTLQMHIRAPLGTRIEVASRIASLAANDIQKLFPGKVEGIVNNCGLPIGPHNLAFIPTPTIGTQDCDMTVTLKDSESPVWDYRKIIRKELRRKYPGTEFTFQPADLTAKILNFGSPSPIMVRIMGMDFLQNYEYTRILASEFKKIAGASDVVIQQVMRMPTFIVQGNRVQTFGVNSTESTVATDLLMTTSGSQQIDQQYWYEKETTLSYQVNIYTPQQWMTKFEDLQTIPVNGRSENLDGPTEAQLLGNLTSITAEGSPGLVTHLGIQPVFDIYISAESRDLGSILDDVKKVAKNLEEKMPKTASMIIQGQAETMNIAYTELIIGILASILFVYLIMVVNFQSWLEPFVIITALPGALAGIAWALFITHTNISVPALTGAIMCVGTATANSILVVAHARECFNRHNDAFLAAVEAGYARIRPVLMTALAMIVGMLPMSIGNSQNAPLGRAVMGGLTFATIATLFFVPCVYAIVYGRFSKDKNVNDDPTNDSDSTIKEIG